MVIKILRDADLILQHSQLIGVNSLPDFFSVAFKLYAFLSKYIL